MTPLTAAAACALGAAALTATVSRRELAHRRLTTACGTGVKQKDHASGGVPRLPRQARWSAGLLAGIATALIGAGPVGAAAGVAVLIVLPAVLARWTVDPRDDWTDRILADLPLTLDLVAACLSAGAPPAAAMEAVADAVGGPLGAELSVVARGLRLGADPAAACARLTQAARKPAPIARSPLVLALSPRLRTAGTDRRPFGAASLDAFARAVGRADESGGHLAAGLLRIADAERASAHSRGLAAARRVGVHAVGPLGACFLPAFVLIGIVPVIAGATSHLMV